MVPNNPRNKPWEVHKKDSDYRTRKGETKPPRKDPVGNEVNKKKNGGEKQKNGRRKGGTKRGDWGYIPGCRSDRSPHSKQGLKSKKKGKGSARARRPTTHPERWEKAKGVQIVAQSRAGQEQSDDRKGGEKN